MNFTDPLQHTGVRSEFQIPKASQIDVFDGILAAVCSSHTLLFECRRSCLFCGRCRYNGVIMYLFRNKLPCSANTYFSHVDCWEKDVNRDPKHLCQVWRGSVSDWYIMVLCDKYGLVFSSYFSTFSLSERNWF